MSFNVSKSLITNILHYAYDTLDEMPITDFFEKLELATNLFNGLRGGSFEIATTSENADRDLEDLENLKKLGLM